MKYDIFGGILPAVEITLQKGESIYTQSGGMSWMTDGFTMETSTKGGVLKGLARSFSGESMFMATYTANSDDSKITFAASVPGEIKPLSIDASHEYIAQKGAFLCAENNVNIKSVFTKSFGAGLFGGEGFILQEISGSGTAFLELDGSLKEMELAPGERIKVDTGNVAFFEKSVGYSVETVKGFKNILFGGEGLFLTVLTGPGKVWLQTVSLSEFASKIRKYIPTKSN
ncbi:MAG: TIGR00266 family protein [Oscillospiraceae bacterium]|nr:TIGR00266 family protein [Oscillospiraceae bacterium]